MYGIIANTTNTKSEGSDYHIPETQEAAIPLRPCGSRERNLCGQRDLNIDDSDVNDDTSTEIHHTYLGFEDMSQNAPSKIEHVDESQ